MRRPQGCVITHRRRPARAAGTPSTVQAVYEAMLDAERFEDLPGKWQAAVVAAEQNRPELRLMSDD